MKGSDVIGPASSVAPLALGEEEAAGNGDVLDLFSGKTSDSLRLQS